jgi:hypothetical protein
MTETTSVAAPAQLQRQQLDQVLRELKQEHGRVLSTPLVAERVRDRLGVEVTAVYRVYGSLKTALERVGAIPSRVHQVKPEARYERLVRKLAAQLDKTPSVQDWDAARRNWDAELRARTPGARPISRAYGGWTAFLEAAGLEPRPAQLRGGFHSDVPRRG